MSQKIGWVSLGYIPSHIHHNILRALEFKDGLSYKESEVDDFTSVLVEDEPLFMFHNDLGVMVELGWISVSSSTYHITDKGREILRGLSIIFDVQKEK